MTRYLLLLTCCAFLCSSCENKTKKYLVKKWDCVQVENLTPMDKSFISKEDSAIALQMENALKTLSWTFNSDNTYFCTTLGNRVTVQGTYEIAEDDKSIMLISSSKNSTNSYRITSLSDIEMTLTSTATSVPLVLHFSPH